MACRPPVRFPAVAGPPSARTGVPASVRSSMARGPRTFRRAPTGLSIRLTSSTRAPTVSRIRRARVLMEFTTIFPLRYARYRQSSTVTTRGGRGAWLWKGQEAAARPTTRAGRQPDRKLKGKAGGLLGRCPSAPVTRRVRAGRAHPGVRADRPTAPSAFRPPSRLTRAVAIGRSPWASTNMSSFANRSRALQA